MDADEVAALKAQVSELRCSLARRQTSGGKDTIMTAVRSLRSQLSALKCEKERLEDAQWKMLETTQTDFVCVWKALEEVQWGNKKTEREMEICDRETILSLQTMLEKRGMELREAQEAQNMAAHQIATVRSAIFASKKFVWNQLKFCLCSSLRSVESLKRNCCKKMGRRKRVVM